MLTKNLILIDPTPDLEAEFLSLVDEYLETGEGYPYHEEARQDFPTFIRKLMERASEERIPRGSVPMSTYWMVEDGRFLVGESRLRHRLSPFLETEGGHIGYAIRPSRRGQGYGTRILSLTLEKARELGLKRVLTTCEAENAASARILEKHGGVLAGAVVSQYSHRKILQYWINL